MRTKIFYLLTFAIVCSSFKVFAQDGEQLFKSNCASCHTIGKGKLVGPDLKDVDTRYDATWLMSWIKSSQAMVKSGDKIAVQLFNDNNKIPMPDVALKDDEIKSILSYVKTKGADVVTATSAAVSTAAASNTVADNTSTNAGTSETNSSFTFSEYIMMLLIGLMLVIILGLTRIIKTLAVKVGDEL